ncbi:MAG: tRNA preQ1(34) S-adenosylmethionine ribosyltransferase-isomerase QueA [Anaerolineae bacterium]
MHTSEFDYELPPDRIAQTPIEPRDAARLMVIHRDTGEIHHRVFRDIIEYLQPADLLVANDSRVIPVRLFARKVPTGGRVELLLLVRHGERTWETLVKGRKVVPGTKLEVRPADSPDVGARTVQREKPIVGEVLEITPSGGRLIRFDQPITPQLEVLGETPLPPYIHEPLKDSERYQTVYARVQGSAAAPTAGLHFTPELIDQIQACTEPSRSDRGVEFAFVTLHIGLDTFRPVQTERIEEHEMHSEYAVLPPETAEVINQTRQAGGRVIAVGTTVVRVLETVAQSTIHNPALSSVEGPQFTIRNLELTPFSGWTDLFIYPGYHFHVVDALITNFHLPRSTLLMLVSAFAGKDLIFRAYDSAIEENYRFYSFGDAMFIK